MGYSVATIELRDRFEMFNKGDLSDLYVAVDDAPPVDAITCDAMCSLCEGVCSDELSTVDGVRSYDDPGTFVYTTTLSRIPDEDADDDRQEVREHERQDRRENERHENEHDTGEGREHEHEHGHEHGHGDEVPEHDHDREPRVPVTQEQENRAS